ncbi:hypothetical protein GOBAR_DD29169 [Gossypium barbadense]|nr:hypothetical protein GOBAR_DD29169 [Gossypium barbadense]
MGVDLNDLLNQGLYEESESDLIIPTLTEREEREEAREWSAKRDEIEQIMWTDYMARNIRMGKGNKERTSKQFRWTKSMEHVFLEILAEEAQKGNKPSNTFKTVSIKRVVEAISERFQVQCDAKHVENHLRTAHKKYEPFLNKSIDHYDEMALVVGKDMATGSFSRTFVDIDLDDANQDSVPIDCYNEEDEELYSQNPASKAIYNLSYIKRCKCMHNNQEKSYKHVNIPKSNNSMDPNDFISHLPDNILHQIILLLPIQSDV